MFMHSISIRKPDWESKSLLINKETDWYSSISINTLLNAPRHHQRWLLISLGNNMSVCMYILQPTKCLKVVKVEVFFFLKEQDSESQKTNEWVLVVDMLVVCPWCYQLLFVDLIYEIKMLVLIISNNPLGLKFYDFMLKPLDDNSAVGRFYSPH